MKAGFSIVPLIYNNPKHLTYTEHMYEGSLSKVPLIYNKPKLVKLH